MSATCNPAGLWAPYRYEAVDVAELATHVHVWRIALEGVPERIVDWLPPDEQSRAGRFARAEDRHRFAGTRAVLRTILADMLGRGDGTTARGLRLRRGEAGKPVLVDDPGLRFNVSHSGGMAMIAVTRSGDVGVDVETQRHVNNIDIVARLAFDEAGSAALLGCPPAMRDAVFLRIWTRKEALVKAMGLGLAALKDPGAVSFDRAGSRWRVSTMPGVEGYVAALARPRAAQGVRLWSWPEHRCDRERAGPAVPMSGTPVRVEVGA